MSVDRPVLYLSYDPPAGRMSALEFGRVDDGQPEDRWGQVGSRLGLLHDAPGGRCVGFTLVDLDGYDVDEEDHADLWDAPRFDVPALGLTDVAPNAIVVAARAQLGDHPTINRLLFSAGIEARGDDALRQWTACLQAGDSMAHFALGYTLCEMGRVAEAYRHLRHYCEIAPAEPRAWAWYGRAAAVCGETGEAERALERAIDIEDPDTPTDATEVLERVRAGEPLGPERPDTTEEDDDADDDWLDEILRALWIRRHVASVADPQVVLLDAHPTPVVLERDELGVVLRAMVGSGDDHRTAALAIQALEEVAEGDDLFVDDDSVWLEMTAAEGDTRVTRRGLEIMVAGIAAEAAAIRLRLDEAVDEEDELAASPTFDELRITLSR